MNLIGQQLAIRRVISPDTSGSAPPVRKPGPGRRSRSDLPDRWRGRRDVASDLARLAASQATGRDGRRRQTSKSSQSVTPRSKEALIDAARELVRSERCFHRARENAIYSRDVTTVAIAHPAIGRRRTETRPETATALVWRIAPRSCRDAVLPDDMSMMMVVMMVPSAVGPAAASSIGVIGGNRQPPGSGELMPTLMIGAHRPAVPDVRVNGLSSAAMPWEDSVLRGTRWRPIRR